MFGPAYDETADRLGSLARSIIECLGTSDALYHNMEHTLLVTMAGRDIIQGLSLCHQIEPDDYTHLVCACQLARFRQYRRVKPRSLRVLGGYSCDGPRGSHECQFACGIYDFGHHGLFFGTDGAVLPRRGRRPRRQCVHLCGLAHRS